MINNNTICVFDFETSGLHPEKDDLVQIAAIMIDPRGLEFIPGSEFNSLVRPVGLMEGDDEEIIDARWAASARAFEVNGKKREDLEKAALPEHVWKEFVNHVAKYNKAGARNDAWSRPIACGHNIQGFDLNWVDVYSMRYGTLDAYGKPKLFNPRTILDTINLCFYWFENSQEPDNFKMDTLRDFVGLKPGERHDALGDCKATGELLIRFMKIHRHYSPKVKFKAATR